MSILAGFKWKTEGMRPLKYLGVNGSIRLKCVIGWVGMDWILVTQVKKWQAIVSMEVELWVKNCREFID
jgi:hypothetical protein